MLTRFWDLIGSNARGSHDEDGSSSRDDPSMICGFAWCSSIEEKWDVRTALRVLANLRQCGDLLELCLEF